MKRWKELEREVVGYLRTSLTMWVCVRFQVVGEMLTELLISEIDMEEGAREDFIVREALS